MAEPATIEERIRRSYPELSGQLRAAADFAARRPVDVVTRSLRAVAVESGVSPATFSRLARALGYEDFEEMREAGRQAMGRRMRPFSERAEALRQSGAHSTGVFLERHATVCAANLLHMGRSIPQRDLEAAVDTLHTARSVTIVGSLGSFGSAHYLGYVASWFRPTWSVLQNSQPLSSGLSALGQGDAMLAIAKHPYAKRTIAALRAAREQNVETVVITDTLDSPALMLADHGFSVPSESPHFFSSYAATIVLVETLATMLLSRSGPAAEAAIRAREERIARFGESWDGETDR